MHDETTPPTETFLRRLRWRTVVAGAIAFVVPFGLFLALVQHATESYVREEFDGRRLRPNIVIGGVAGLAERGWEGFALAAGGALIGVHSLRSRCVMTTYDPDTQAQDPEVLKRIVGQFAGRIALDCYVIHEGAIRVGDQVELIERHSHAPVATHFGRYA